MTVFGDLRANGLRFSRYLREQCGVNLQLLLSEESDRPWTGNLTRPLDHDLPWVHFYEKRATNPLAMLRCLRSLKRLCASHPFLWARSGGGMYCPFLGHQFVMQTVGSDVADMELLPWWRRRLILQALRRARLVLASQIRHLPILRGLGLDHVFMPLPVWGPPVDDGGRQGRPQGFDLVFFSSSWFYWHGVGEIPKGNDRFLRAFARFTETGANACLVAVEHGPDIAEAKALIRDLGIQDRVFFRDRATQRELSRCFYECDVVVDSFLYGEPGLATLDAMSHGRTAMVYVDDSAARMACGDDLHPVVNVSTEEEILEGLHRLSSDEYRLDLGRQAAAWWRRHHHPEVVAQGLLPVLSRVLR